MKSTTIAQSTKSRLKDLRLKSATFKILKVGKWNLYYTVCHIKKLPGARYQICTYFGEVSMVSQKND